RPSDVPVKRLSSVGGGMPTTHGPPFLGLPGPGSRGMFDDPSTLPTRKPANWPQTCVPAVWPRNATLRLHDWRDRLGSERPQRGTRPGLRQPDRVLGRVTVIRAVILTSWRECRVHGADCLIP